LIGEMPSIATGLPSGNLPLVKIGTIWS
jgi:hypothetical protein